MRGVISRSMPDQYGQWPASVQSVAVSAKSVCTQAVASASVGATVVTTA